MSEQCFQQKWLGHFCLKSTSLHHLLKDHCWWWHEKIIQVFSPFLFPLKAVAMNMVSPLSKHCLWEFHLLYKDLVITVGYGGGTRARCTTSQTLADIKAVSWPPAVAENWSEMTLMPPGEQWSISSADTWRKVSLARRLPHTFWTTHVHKSNVHLQADAYV